MKPRWILLPVILCAALCVAGCGSLSKASSRREAIAKLTQAKDGALGCIMYADDHGGQYPANFSDIAGYFKDNTNHVTNLIAGFDLVYTGATTNIVKPADTIVIREKQPWKKTGTAWLKAYAFADGHAEIHAARDGNFEAWENERIVKP